MDVDLIVIGTGPAGASAAFECRKAGWRVAMVDERAYGGTCALRGCDPKKVLMAASEAVESVRRLRGKGVEGDLRINWAELMRFKRSFTETVPTYKEKEFTDAGITTLHGTAQFTGKNQIRVNEQEIRAERILVATGARPAPLDFEGNQYVITSDQFLELDELPDRMVFIGGGYISFEFAHLVNRAGLQAFIIEKSTCPLRQYDMDLTHQLIRASQESGIDIRLNTQIQAIDKTGDGYVVYLENDYGKHAVEAGLVVHGAGRIPNVEALQLANAGVETDKQGILVNDFMQSISNPSVFAAGDVASAGAQLTPVAGMQAKILVNHWLNGSGKKVNYAVTPAVLFTLPPMASVGLQESEAKKQKSDYRIHQQDMSRWFPYKRINEQYCGFKIITDNQTDQILGAHLLGHQSEELINLFAIAIQCKLKITDLQQIMYAYPTHGTYIRRMIN